MKFAVAACAAFAACMNVAAQQPPCPDAPSRIVMESGSYSSQPGVTFRLRNFSATLVPMGKTEPTCLQKMTDVAHATIFVSNASLTEVFTKKLGAAESKIRDLKVEHGVNRVTLSGEIVKVIPIRFSIEGPISTDGTLIIMNASKITADGIPLKMLLDMVGEHLGSLLAFKGVNGVFVNGDTMAFSPEKIAHLRGYIASVESSPEGLTLHYGRKPRAHAQKVPVKAG